MCRIERSIENTDTRKLVFAHHKTVSCDPKIETKTLSTAAANTLTAPPNQLNNNIGLLFLQSSFECLLNKIY